MKLSSLEMKIGAVTGTLTATTRILEPLESTLCL
jgi:hypothetical protein